MLRTANTSIEQRRFRLKGAYPLTFARFTDRQFIFPPRHTCRLSAADDSIKLDGRLPSSLLFSPAPRWRAPLFVDLDHHHLYDLTFSCPIPSQSLCCMQGDEIRTVLTRTTTKSTYTIFDIDSSSGSLNVGEGGFWDGVQKNL